MGFTPTKEEIRKELLLCGRNVNYYIENYCKISHPLKGLIPFKLFPFQQKLVTDFKNHRFNIVLKARQLGISTLAAAYVSWFILFHRSKNVLVLATKMKTSANLVRKVKLVFKHLPEWMMIAKNKVDNATSFELDNGSIVTASAKSSDVGRSEALSLLLIDESAHVDGLDELWAAIWPTLSCVAGDTLILTNNGFQRIEDIVGEEREIGAYTPINNLEVYGKERMEIVSHSYVSPESKTLKIKTRHGLELEVTKNHPLYKLFSFGGSMEQAKNLKVGDHLRVDAGMNVFGNRDSILFKDEKFQITEDLAYMLGGWISEGWIEHNEKRDTTIFVSNSDQEFRDVYLNSQIIKSFHAKNNDSCKLLCCSKDLIDLYKAFGIESSWKCDTKRIPKMVFSFNKELLSSFLRGMFDGDGCCSNRGVCLSSTSLKLLQETQLLLLNYGIVANIASGHKPTKDIGVRKMPSGQILQSLKDSWNLYIPYSQSQLFKDSIGFRIERKKEKLDKFIDEKDQDDRKQFEIPVDIIESGLASILEKFKKGSGYRSLRYQGLRADRILYKRSKKRYINRSWILKLKEICEINDVFLDLQEEILLNELSYSCLWDEIISITESSNKTYDLTVPGTHTFLQNGILGNNTGGACMLLSSPNGCGNQYHKIWTESEAGLNEFHRTKLMWNVHPERDKAWYEKETKNMSQREISQELECSFLMSGTSVFDPADMARLELGLSDPISRTGIDRNLWIWEKYDPSSSFCLISDVARGDGKDFSVFHIFNLNTMEIVAEYQGRLTPDLFSQVILSAAQEYGNCLVIVENNTVGFAVLEKLIDAKYPNIYYSTKVDHEFVDQYEADQLGNSAVAGFSTTSKTRPLIVAKAEEYIRNDKVKIHSSRLLNEMKTFIWENGKPQAMRSYNDDLVMALAIACWVRDTALSANAKDVAYKKAFLECATKMVQRIDYSVVGEPGHMSPTKKEVKNQIKNGYHGDYMWIYKG